MKDIMRGKLMHSFQLFKTRNREDDRSVGPAQIVYMTIDMSSGYGSTFTIPYNVFEELGTRGILLQDDSLIVDPSNVTQTKTTLYIFEDKQFNSYNFEEAKLLLLEAIDMQKSILEVD